MILLYIKVHGENNGLISKLEVIIATVFLKLTCSLGPPEGPDETAVSGGLTPAPQNQNVQGENLGNHI